MLDSHSSDYGLPIGAEHHACRPPIRRRCLETIGPDRNSSARASLQLFELGGPEERAWDLQPGEIGISSSWKDSVVIDGFVVRALHSHLI